jgi:hypothetical protein
MFCINNKECMSYLQFKLGQGSSLGFIHVCNFYMSSIAFC